MSTISVVVPSRLARNPISTQESLWLDRALMSAKYQDVDGATLELIVCLDPGAKLPARFSDVVVATADKPGQAAALNAGMRAATGDVVAFLEDDDAWHVQWSLRERLRHLDDHDLVTTNQREVTVEGDFVRTNDFPTPSGWVMTRALADRFRFDETFKWHVDTQALGELTALGARRVHLVEHGADRTSRPWLDNVAHFSVIAEHSHHEPIVTRTLHRGSGMAKIATDPAAQQESWDEHQRMHAFFGHIPW